jgi:hypothetical protein
MLFSAQSSKIVRDLIAAGVIPADCVRFRVTVEINQAVVIETTRYAAEAELRAIANTVIAHPEESAREDLVIDRRLRSSGRLDVGPVA